MSLDIDLLKDEASILMALNAAVLQEKQADAELRGAVDDAKRLASQMRQLESLPTRLIGVEDQATDLEQRVSATCRLAENVSRKVRALDRVRERVAETTKKVEDIIDLKQCIDGVQEAMSGEDYERAAAYIQRFAHLDESVLDRKSSELLKRAADDLRQTIRLQIEVASRSNRRESLVRFCRLYAPLGDPMEGVNQYAQFLRKRLRVKAAELIEELQNSENRRQQGGGDDGDDKAAGDGDGKAERRATYVDTITHLFEFVAELIEDERQGCLDNFGPMGVVVLCKHMQEQTDVHATRVLQMFASAWHVQEVAGMVARGQLNVVVPGSDKKSGKTGSGVVRTDLRTLGVLLDELAILSQSCEMFDKFLRAKAHADLERCEPEQRALFSTKDGLLHVSSLNRKVQEIMSAYVSIEDVFMTQSVRRALQMDSVEAESMTSTAVDYVFVVLQRCTQRSLETCSIDCVCAIINLANACVNRDFRDALEGALRESTSVRITRTEQERHAELCLALNNLRMCADNLLRIRDELDRRCADVFGGANLSKARSCLAELEQTSGEFQHLLGEQVEAMAHSLQPRINPLLDSFDDVPHELSEEEYAANSVNDPFVQQLLSQLSAVFAPLREHLVEANWEAVLDAVMRRILNQLEALVMVQRFNQLGALQLDADLMTLSTFFQSLSSRTIRDKFARLTQLSSLLNLTEPAELLDFWEDANWRLTPAEVRAVLRLRVEFNEKDIKALKL